MIKECCCSVLPADNRPADRGFVCSPSGLSGGCPALFVYLGPWRQVLPGAWWNVPGGRSARIDLLRVPLPAWINRQDGTTESCGSRVTSVLPGQAPCGGGDRVLFPLPGCGGVCQVPAAGAALRAGIAEQIRMRNPARRKGPRPLVPERTCRNGGSRSHLSGSDGEYGDEMEPHDLCTENGVAQCSAAREAGPKPAGGRTPSGGLPDAEGSGRSDSLPPGGLQEAEGIDGASSCKVQSPET